MSRNFRLLVLMAVSAVHLVQLYICASLYMGRDGGITETLFNFLYNTPGLNLIYQTEKYYLILAVVMIITAAAIEINAILKVQNALYFIATLALFYASLFFIHPWIMGSSLFVPVDGKIWLLRIGEFGYTCAFYLASLFLLKNRRPQAPTAIV